jgi:putative phage-type endonuclease
MSELENIIIQEEEEEELENIIIQEEESKKSEESEDEESEDEEQEDSVVLSTEQYDEIEQQIHILIDQYLTDPEELVKFIKPDFLKEFIQEITHTIFDGLVLSETCKDTDETILETIEEIVENEFELFMDIHEIPKRSEVSEIPIIDFQKNNILITQLNKLRDIPQPVQRTKEWYEFRHSLITASNIYKALGSEANMNSLIYEKCKPVVINDGSGYVNTDSPMHWGTKYEALTIMLYEHKNSTKIGEFGCIPHSTYKFIGASPDGINIDPESPLYGRMLEIKNIVNREIDGIPSEAYWTQMQIQMETCELEECDFVETRFKQYNSEEEFWLDTGKGKGEKGVVLYFIRRDHSQVAPLYKFIPLDIILEKSNILQWIESVKESVNDEWILYETNYWYLDQYSCVLVRRNKKWFEAALPKIKSIWTTIERERIEGYAHRAPKKKPQKNPVEEYIISESNGQKVISIMQNKPVSIIKLG